MSTTHATPTGMHRLHFSSWLVAILVLAAVLIAGVAGYASAGGLTSESAPGQDVGDRVIRAFTTPDQATIAAVYDPSLQSVLIWDGAQHLVARSAKEQAAAIKAGLAIGNTYKLIRPVSTYKATNGDLYVAHIIEVRGPGHPTGDPIIGFWRVHNGKVVRQIGLDAMHP